MAKHKSGELCCPATALILRGGPLALASKFFVLGQLKCCAAGPPGQLNFSEKKLFVRNGAAYSQSESASVM